VPKCGIFGIATFIDGTGIDIPEPCDGSQRDYLNGHSRQHEIRFQLVVTPDGILRDVSDPFVGSHGYNEDRLKEVARMTRRSFEVLCELLRDKADQ
jgi:hypothetical protein